MIHSGMITLHLEVPFKIHVIWLKHSSRDGDTFKDYHNLVVAHRDTKKCVAYMYEFNLLCGKLAFIMPI